MSHLHAIHYLGTLLCIECRGQPRLLAEGRPIVSRVRLSELFVIGDAPSLRGTGVPVGTVVVRSSMMDASESMTDFLAISVRTSRASPRTEPPNLWLALRLHVCIRAVAESSATHLP